MQSVAVLVIGPLSLLPGTLLARTRPRTAGAWMLAAAIVVTVLVVGIIPHPNLRWCICGFEQQASLILCAAPLALVGLWQVLTPLRAHATVVNDGRLRTAIAMAVVLLVVAGIAWLVPASPSARDTDAAVASYVGDHLRVDMVILSGSFGGESSSTWSWRSWSLPSRTWTWRSSFRATLTVTQPFVEASPSRHAFSPGDVCEINGTITSVRVDGRWRSEITLWKGASIVRGAHGES
jgi:hypothetical protein